MPAGMLALFLAACPAGWSLTAPPRMLHQIPAAPGEIYITQVPITLQPSDGHVWCAKDAERPRQPTL